MKRLENTAFEVGRAGHDPATYGLKGRATNSVSPEDSRGAVAHTGNHVPSIAQVQGLSFPVGCVVEVVGGLRKGQRGRVLGEARSTYHGVSDLVVRFEDGMERWIGPDMLRRLG